jgi:hypothetical protein
MIVINGMPITNELVDFLKQATYENFEETYFDGDVDAMLALNDYLIQNLTSVSLDDTVNIKAISVHLVNVKATKDRMKELSALLKKCREEGVKS